MLPQTDAFHQSSRQILLDMKELRIGQLLRQANIRKVCGIPALELFHALFLLVFHGKNLLRFLTGSSRKKMLVLDDSVLPRNRSKSVELLARVHDHVTAQYLRGFNLLTLGWTDGFSFVPVAFKLLSSAKQQNRYVTKRPGRELTIGRTAGRRGWAACSKSRKRHF